MLTQPQKRNITLKNGAALLDHIIDRQTLKNDAHLSHALDVAPSVISKIRHAKLPVCANFILRVHETFGMPVKDIRTILEA